MGLSAILRLHWAALRALLVLTVVLGLAYPALVWLVAQLPVLHERADGSLMRLNGSAVGSSLIGQSFADADGAPVQRYFQSRPSNAGAGYDPGASGAGNLGPESVVDIAGAPSLLTQVCARSKVVAQWEGLGRDAGARPFCTPGGVGAVLSVIGPRDARGVVTQPSRVISVNEVCDSVPRPFLASYRGVRVECAQPGADYAIGQIVPIRGDARADPLVPPDAVTAGGSGLDPHISPAYADLQIDRVARARAVPTDRIRELVRDNTDGRGLGFLGEPRVNVLALNIALDQRFPAVK